MIFRLEIFLKAIDALFLLELSWDTHFTNILSTVEVWFVWKSWTLLNYISLQINFTLNQYISFRPNRQIPIPNHIDAVHNRFHLPIFSHCLPYDRCSHFVRHNATIWEYTGRRCIEIHSLNIGGRLRKANFQQTSLLIQKIKKHWTITTHIRRLVRPVQTIYWAVTNMKSWYTPLTVVTRMLSTRTRFSDCKIELSPF